MRAKHKRKKKKKKTKKNILTCSVMRSCSCNLKRRICGSGYCTGKHDCSLSNSRSKLGGYGYCTGQHTQKHDDFHHESLHTEHDQRKHDQLGGRTQSSFSTEQPQPASAHVAGVSLPPPARARLPEPHSSCYPQPRDGSTLPTSSAWPSRPPPHPPSPPVSPSSSG